MSDFTIKVIDHPKFWKTVLPQYRSRVSKKIPEIRQQIEHILSGKSSGKELHKKLKGYPESKRPIYKCRVGQNFRLSYQYIHRKAAGGISNIYLILLKFTPHDAQGRDNLRMAANIEEERRLIQEGWLVQDGDLVTGLEDDFELEDKWGRKDSTFQERMFIRDEAELHDLIDYASTLGDEEAERIFCTELCYMLDAEQSMVVDHYTSDVLVKGCAGSGKSLVGLRWLQNHRRHGPVEYLTFADKLCEDMEETQTSYESFLQYRSKKNPIDFDGQTLHPINFITTHKWFLKQANASQQYRYQDAHESYESFKQWYLENLGERERKNEKDETNSSQNKEYWDIPTKAKLRKYRPEEVWSEIRGVIKGNMGLGLLRGRIFRNEPKLQSGLKLLESRGWVEKSGTNWQVTQHAVEKNYISWKRIDYTKIDDLTKEQEKKILEVHRHIQNSLFVKDEGILPVEVYLRLPIKYSRFGSEDRMNLYNIAERYHNWRSQSRCRDDVDLALDVIKQSGNIKSKDIRDGGALFIDEAQDLTELQLFTLIHLNADKSIMFAADQQQIIHPTYFSTGRLEEKMQALLVANRELNKVHLRKNWRCTAQLVEFQNCFCQLRNFEDSMSDYEDAEAVGESGNPVIWIHRSPENERVLVRLWQEHTSKMRILLIEKNSFPYGVNGISSIQEYKGAESTMVLAWSVMGTMEETWRVRNTPKAIRTRTKEERDRLRLAMNIFYVAITRARKTLVIYESSKSAGSSLLEIAVKDNRCEKWDIIDEYKLERLKRIINEITIEDQLKDARSSESNGDYEHAAFIYREVKYFYDEIRCEAKIAKRDGRFSDAIRNYLLAGMPLDTTELLGDCEDECLWVAAQLAIVNMGKQADNEPGDYVKAVNKQWAKKFATSTTTFEKLLLEGVQQFPIIRSVLTDHLCKCGTSIAGLSKKISQIECEMGNKISKFYLECRRMSNE